MKQIISFLLYLFPLISNSQSWQLLVNSPSSTSFRHDDIYFINADTGWVCNVDGKIYKTTDGGMSWITQLDQPNTSFRCIGFSNALNGWAGNLGTGRWSPTVDTMPLYYTIDGGTNWSPVLNITGTLPQGICGISVVNDSVVYAVGRVGGSAYLLKTLNAGSSWTSIDMNALAFQLIDCKFFSPDTGFVVGGFPGPTFSNSKNEILYTTDGGTNWQAVYIGLDSNQLCWKIHFVNRMLGYVSIESEIADTAYVLKTIDGGLTWQKKLFDSGSTYGEQGIGFVNDSVGWSGFFGGDTKATINGGNTWTADPVINNFNRLRCMNDTLAYAVGNRVWKYTTSNVGVGEEQKLPGFFIESVGPNPFTEKTTVNYRIPSPGLVSIRLYDFAGRPIKLIEEKLESAGLHQINIELPYCFDTHFYVVVNYDHHKRCAKIISVK